MKKQQLIDNINFDTNDAANTLINIPPTMISDINNSNRDLVDKKLPAQKKTPKGGNHASMAERGAPLDPLSVDR